MTTSAIEAGRAFVRIMAQDDTKKTLDKIGARFKAWGAGIAATGAALSAASAGILGTMAAAVNQFSTVGSDLTDMSGRTGVAASALSELGFAAGQGGASIQDLEAAMRTMAKKTGQSGEKAFLSYADAISKIEDPGKRAQKAMEIFGKSGTKLLPMLEGGAAGIQQLREQARLMGVTLTDEDAAAADKLGDALALLMGTIRGVVLQIGAAVAPMVQFAVDALQPIATTIVRIIKENRGLVQAFAIGAAIVGALGGVLLTVGGALVGIGGLLAALPAIVAGVSAAIGVLGSIFAAIFSPLGILIGAVVAAVAALAVGLGFLGYWFLTSTQWGRGFMAALGQLWQLAVKTFKGIADALQAGNLKLAGKVALAGLNVAWVYGLTTLKNAWLGFTTMLVDAISAAMLRVAAIVEPVFARIAKQWNNLAGTLGLGQMSYEEGDLAKGIEAGRDKFEDAAAMKRIGNLADRWAAKEQLDALAKEAADGKAAIEARAKGPGREQWDSGLMDVVDTLKRSSAGTFSGFAAGLLGQAGGSAIEKELKKQTGFLKDIKDNTDELDGGGLGE